MMKKSEIFRYKLPLIFDLFLVPINKLDVLCTRKLPINNFWQRNKVNEQILTTFLRSSCYEKGDCQRVYELNYNSAQVSMNFFAIIEILTHLNADTIRISYFFI